MQGFSYYILFGFEVGISNAFKCVFKEWQHKGRFSGLFSDLEVKIKIRYQKRGSIKKNYPYLGVDTSDWGCFLIETLFGGEALLIYLFAPPRAAPGSVEWNSTQKSAHKTRIASDRG